MAWDVAWGKAINEGMTDPPTRWVPNAAPKGACLRPAGKGERAKARKKEERAFGPSVLAAVAVLEAVFNFP